MNHTALYYPYMSPPESWIKRSLLLFETISSIVPAEHGAPTPDLRRLETEGVWRPAHAWMLADPTYGADITAAVQAFANKDSYRFNKSYLHPRDVERLYLGKLNYEIERSLQESQLSKLVRHDRVAVHRDVATVILAVTAKYLAASNNDVTTRLIPTTDSPLNADFAYSPVPHAPIVDQCLELGLGKLLPTPSPDVSLEDVIKFREKHDRELAAFRQAIRSFMSEVASSLEPLETIRNFREQIEDAIGAMSWAGRKRNLRFLWSTVGVLLAGVSAATLMDPSTTHWVFDGIGTTATVALASGTARRTSNENLTPGPFSYVLSSKLQFDR